VTSIGLLAALVILNELLSLNQKLQIFDLLACLFSPRFFSKHKSHSNKKARLLAIFLFLSDLDRITFGVPLNPLLKIENPIAPQFLFVSL